MPKLTVPVIYSEGTRLIDRLLRQLAMDDRVTEAERTRAREAGASLISILVNAQARVRRTGSA